MILNAKILILELGILAEITREKNRMSLRYSKITNEAPIRSA